MAALLAIFIIFSCSISFTFACNGYKVKDLKISMCDNQDELLEFENFSAQINENCEVAPQGCIVVKKQINSGNGSYLVEKKAKMGMPIKLSGKKDLCTLLEKSKDSPEIDLIFKMLNLEQHCPLKEGKICGNGNVSIGKYKDQIRMLEGDFEGTIRGKADSGDVCIHFDLTIGKDGKSTGFPMG